MTPSVLPCGEGGLIDGKYRLGPRIGGGAMGVVYRAEHVHLRRTVAVKLLWKTAPDAEAVLRFRREAEALGRLRHPNIVEVADFGIDPATRQPYLVMEYLEGGSLHDLSRSEGPLPPSRALPILEAVAAGLDHAHAQGVLHRDLKPGNVLLCGDLETPGVKILDFGLARLDAETPREAFAASDASDSPLSTPDLTGSSALLGTPLYAPPEAFRGVALTAASDVYSFGALAYELLCGRPPFTGTTPEVMAGHLEALPPDPASFGVALAPGFLAGIRRALAKDPIGRPSSASEIVTGFRAAWLAARQRDWRKRETPRRLAFAGLLAATLAAPSTWLSTMEPVAALERLAEDLRFALRPSRPADPRILILSFDEASLASAGAPLAARADELAQRIEAVFEAGAEGVALDLVLPAAWSASPAFSELVVRRAARLRLAAIASPSGRILGTECVTGLASAALEPRGVSALFGLANVHADADGRVREGHLFHREVAGGRRPSWAAAASSLLGIRPDHGEPAFVLDQAVDPGSFRWLRWRDLPQALRGDRGTFEGKLVLVGGDQTASGDDVHRLPSTSGRPRGVSGIALQAMMVQTILEGLPVRRAGLGARLAFASLAGAIAASVCLGIGTAAQARRAVGLMGAGLAAAAGSFRWTGVLLPLVAPMLAALIAGALALAARSRLAILPR